MWMVSSAAGSRRGDRADARNVRNELEVQRTNKRAELTAFLCLFRKAIGLTMASVTKELLTG